jgi:hypothetical protein
MSADAAVTSAIAIPASNKTFFNMLNLLVVVELNSENS